MALQLVSWLGFILSVGIFQGHLYFVFVIWFVLVQTQRWCYWCAFAIMGFNRTQKKKSDLRHSSTRTFHHT